jgi:phosphohistidine phosphatase
MFDLKLYLIRHGDARNETDDPERPLSERGRREIAQTAHWAIRHGRDIVEIRHSGKLRARQSAEILAHHLRPARGVVALAGLEPHDDVWPVAAELAAASGTLMIVGHLPFLGRLAGLLVARDPERSVTAFVTGAAALLERGGEQWRLVEAFAPELPRI